MGRGRAYRTAAFALLLGCLGLSWTTRARAEATLDGDARASLRGIAALSVGRGLRFNNPYRLATPLGDTPESVSLSATYLDLSLGILSGAHAFRHGGALSGALALQGIGQLVLTPAYVLEVDLARAFALRGRLGLPVVVAPDASVGMEAGFASKLGVAYGLGLLAEVVGSVFFGAATEDRSVTTIPIVALQLGLCFERGLPW